MCVAALLLGCIIKGSSRFMERIREHLPAGKFRLLAFVLAKFLSILSLTSGMGKSGEEAILDIVRLLEAQDKISSSGDHDNGYSNGQQQQRSLSDVDAVSEADADDGSDHLLLLSSKPLYRNHRHSSDSPTSSSAAYSSKYCLNTSDEDHNDDSFADLVAIQ